MLIKLFFGKLTFAMISLFGGIDELFIPNHDLSMSMAIPSFQSFFYAPIYRNTKIHGPGMNG